MIWPLLIITAGALTIASKAKTKTKVSKVVSMGSRSGETWDVEEFPQAGLVVVHSRRPGDKTVATFRKDPATQRFVFSQGKGSQTIIALMREDFEAPPAAKAAE
jgi:hypothetical protein